MAEVVLCMVVYGLMLFGDRMQLRMLVGIEIMLLPVFRCGAHRRGDVGILVCFAL